MTRRTRTAAESPLDFVEKVAAARAEASRGETRYTKGDRVGVRLANQQAIAGVVISARATALYGEVVKVRLSGGTVWEGTAQRVTRKEGT